MPPAIVAALIGAGVSGTEMGLSASGALNPTPETPNSILQQPGAPNSPQTQQLQAAMRAAAPYAAEQTSGYLANPSQAEVIASLAGSPADIGLAQQTVFGSPSMFTPGLATGQS